MSIYSRICRATIVNTLDLPDMQGFHLIQNIDMLFQILNELDDNVHYGSEKHVAEDY